MEIGDDTHQAFHRGTAPVFALLTAEQTRQLAELHADPGALAERLTELAEKANEDLSPGERALSTKRTLKPITLWRRCRQKLAFGSLPGSL